jgi:hypothetical protein
MKLKSILILVIFSLMSFSIQAEGLFNKSNSSTQKSTDPRNAGKVLRDPPGGGPGTVPGADDPIPDGLLILSLFAGGYAVFNKARKKKELHEI